jgi:hypothetical protein
MTRGLAQRGAPRSPSHESKPSKGVTHSTDGGVRTSPLFVERRAGMPTARRGHVLPSSHTHANGRVAGALRFAEAPDSRLRRQPRKRTRCAHAECLRTKNQPNRRDSNGGFRKSGAPPPRTRLWLRYGSVFSVNPLRASSPGDAGPGPVARGNRRCGRRLRALPPAARETAELREGIDAFFKNRNLNWLA